MTARKGSVWTWIVGLVVAAPVLYVLSFGPACWWFTDSPKYGMQIAPEFYWSLGHVAHRAGEASAIYRVVSWYVRLGKDHDVIVPTRRNPQLVEGDWCDLAP